MTINISDATRLVVVIACMLVTSGRQVAHAVSIPWQARHGLTAEQYQTTFNELGAQGYRLVDVNGYSVGDQERYAAIWEKRPGPDWQARHGLTNAQYQAAFNDLGSQGYRLIKVSGYTINNQDRYAAIWERRGGPALQARHGLNSTQMDVTIKDLFAQNYRVLQLSGYGFGSEARFAAIFEQSDGPAQSVYFDMTAASYQARFNELGAQGYRLRQISGYVVNDQERFAAIWERRVGLDWQGRHNLTNAQYQSVFTDLVGQGYKLISISGYSIGGQDYYAAVWEKFQDSFDSLPVTGAFVPELSVFDQTMQQFMLTRQIPAGTLTVMKDGNIVFARGYGWQDGSRTIALRPDAMLRLASVVKPITAAMIKNLIAEGKLNADDRVFCLAGSPSNCWLNITPFGTVDTNAKSITIQHLLDHKGGWDRDKSGDPMFDAINIANTLGVTTPPSKVDFARYMLGRPLDHVPGTTFAYSNFGYMLLGLVIEQVTGQSYVDYMRATIFKPNCVPARDIELGRTLPSSRNLREPWYSDPSMATSVFNPAAAVPFPDGGFYLEAMEAHGGLIASGSAIAKFLQAYWINGEPRSGNGQEWTFFGSLPGTHTMARQRPDGVNIVVLFNQRADASDLDYDQIQTLLDNATASVTKWPTSTVSARSTCLFPTQSMRVPVTGGMLISDDGRTSVTFPPNEIVAGITVSYTPKLLPVGANFQSIGPMFGIEATDENGVAVDSFGKPITIVSHFDENMSGVDSAHFRLYWRDGEKWVTDGIATIATDTHTITSTTTHFSDFALLAERQNALYLSILRH